MAEKDGGGGMIKEVYVTPPGKKRFPMPPQRERLAPPPWALGVVLVVVASFIGSCEWVRGM